MIRTALIGSPTSVGAAVSEALANAEPVGKVEPLPGGYSNETWLVESRLGRLVAKIALRAPDGSRLRNSVAATSLAAHREVPVPAILHVDEGCERFGGRAFSVSAYVPGADGEAALPSLSRAERTRFFEDLGAVVARLHGGETVEFANGVDAAQRFANWADVVHSRLDSLPQRYQGAGLDVGSRIKRVVEEVRRMATELSPLVAPSLTHSDLYLANTVVAHGRLRCLLDFEHAQLWDPVADFVKPELLIFPKYPEAKEAFTAGYRRESSLPEEFERRLRLALGLELVWGIPFFFGWRDREILEQYRCALERWPDE